MKTVLAIAVTFLPSISFGAVITALDALQTAKAPGIGNTPAISTPFDFGYLNRRFKPVKFDQIEPLPGGVGLTSSRIDAYLPSVFSRPHDGVESLFLHPGEKKNVYFSFTAPAKGEYVFSGEFEPEDIGKPECLPSRSDRKVKPVPSIAFSRGSAR